MTCALLVCKLNIFFKLWQLKIGFGFYLISVGKKNWSNETLDVSITGDSVEDCQQSIRQRFSRKWHQWWVSIFFSRLAVTFRMVVEFSDWNEKTEWFGFFVCFLSYHSCFSTSFPIITHCKRLNWTENKQIRFRIAFITFNKHWADFSLSQTFYACVYACMFELCLCC